MLTATNVSETFGDHQGNDENDNDDLYSGYNEYPTSFNIRDLEKDDIFQAALQKSSQGKHNPFKPETAYRMGLKSGCNGLSNFKNYDVSPKSLATGRIQIESKDSIQTIHYVEQQPTGFLEDGILRPMTAVRGAGYTSQGRPSTATFDLLNQKNFGSISRPEKLEETPEDKVKKLEKQIMDLIEETSLLQMAGKKKLALSKAKEASSIERNLIRIQETSGLSEIHNLELTFLVLFNLANQYNNNEMYSEALNTYQVITKNKMFSNASRLKVNMGNIYFKLEQYNKAIKMYRMAVDQVPNMYKDLRIKIMHNIGTLFLKTGEIFEACNTFEYIMQEKPDFRAGLHLIYCYYTLSNTEKMKKTFLSILNISLNIDNDKYNQSVADDHQSQLLLEVIKIDDLRQWEKERQKEAEKIILMIAKMIAPVIADNYTTGYNWCLDVVKSSKYSSLASDLDLDKVVMLLKQNDLSSAMEILNVFQDKESRIASIAANNLSFIYYLKGDLDNAEKWGENSKELDSYNASAYVSLGNVAFSRHNFEQAKDLYEIAYENDTTCIEALYNLGLINKKLRKYDKSLSHFMKLDTILRHDPFVMYQLATVNALIGDTDQAAEWYLQLLGVVPSDSGALQELGQLFEREGDKQQAFQYHLDSYRFYPSNLNILEWLGSHCMSLGVSEKALPFYKNAVTTSPKEARWQLLMASCYKNIGNHQKAIEIYKNLHHENPDNIDCLQMLVRLTSKFGLKEASAYALELKRAEKAKEVRERIGSSRPHSRNSKGRSAGCSSNSPTTTKIIPTHLQSNPSFAAFTGRFVQFNSDNSISERDEIFSTNDKLSETVIPNVDSFESSNERPKTSAERKLSEDDFGDDELGDDLLPV